MDPIVLVKVIGFLGLAIVGLVSAYASWQTRRLLITVFGERPRAAQLRAPARIKERSLLRVLRRLKLAANGHAL
jgi:hypothetical protein